MTLVLFNVFACARADAAVAVALPSAAGNADYGGQSGAYYCCPSDAFSSVDPQIIETFVTLGVRSAHASLSLLLNSLPFPFAVLTLQ
jgi:hypothetical protein